MTNQSTLNKLIEMHLGAMSDAFRIQLKDPKMKELSFEDRFGLLVDVEFTTRKNNRLKRLIHNAEFEQVGASVMDIDYTSGRKLNKQLISRLASCEYISEFRNVFITGATGCGKTYLACALGMEACKQYHTVKYIRLPDFLLEMENGRGEGKALKVLEKYATPVLLIIDEWLLLKLTESECRDIFELVHRRRKKSSTIFCSQFLSDGWYERLGGGETPLTDAILDRIIHDAYKINIVSVDPSKDISMRELYGLDKSLSE